MNNIRLKNGFLVDGGGVQRCDLALRDGRIDLSGAGAACERELDLSGKYVLPGFVDIHFHGYNLFDFTLGRFDPATKGFNAGESAYRAGFEMLARTLPSFGITGFYLATFAATAETLKNCYHNLAEYLEDQQRAPEGARLFGGMLEGCFINPSMAGAQNTRYQLEPSREAFDRLEDAGSIKLANVVPDFGRRSVGLTEYLCGKGIVVGAGHTDATCKQFCQAIKAGLKYCIHFTNGPTGGSYKPFNGGGAIEAVLKSDQLYAELIADGFHLNPAYIRDIIKRKGPEKIIGVTDCMFVAGSTVKQFNIDGIAGAVSEDGKYITAIDIPGMLHGSNLTMDRAFENMLNWLTSDMEGIWNCRHQALDFDQALAATVKIYSSNPCELAGLSAEGLGRLADGARADICVLDITPASAGAGPGRYKVKVDSTIVDGKVVYSR